MTFKQLQFFRKTAELENISKAAKELFVAQPALSKAIKDLEEELGFPLFDRNGKKISLNQNGRILHKHVQLIQNDLLQLEHELSEANTKVPHSANISIRVASKLLPDILNTFYIKYPDYNLRVYQLEQNPSSLPPFDVVIDSSPSSGFSAWECVKLLEEKILLALPASHPLAGKEEIVLSDLTGYPCSLLNESYSLGKLLHSKLEAAHFHPNIIFESDNPHMIRDFLKLNLTYSFVPEKTWDIKKDFPQLILREVVDFKCSREIYLSFLQKDYAVLAAREFTAHVWDYFKNL
ncbi:LysR family transcriptional regulator [Anaerocolumna xylanovorans]|uniref:DNA-binding transcriptional regulator, LysR family n=1 Tax=Anaerocolumna xylanovorans DSM 12503 TaxID=1121345 RepID=A0A1M7Y5C2_9FIRM|nr:LysR family transcriptional regulator [Anaerocolumna xylanovorans]SHO47560.1 DNA-binding transcriptional regulator, LysR family [Anaerocolumna xylanovorans DSM 12503]